MPGQAGSWRRSRRPRRAWRARRSWSRRRRCRAAVRAHVFGGDRFATRSRNRGSCIWGYARTWGVLVRNDGGARSARPGFIGGAGARVVAHAAPRFCFVSQADCLAVAAGDSLRVSVLRIAGHGSGVGRAGPAAGRRDGHAVIGNGDWLRVGVSVVGVSPTFGVPIITEIAAERRMYLPLAAILPWLVAGAFLILSRFEKSTAAHGALWPRRTWHSGDAGRGDFDRRRGLVAELSPRGNLQRSIALWEDAAIHQPENARVQNNLGVVLVDDSRPSEAVPHYERLGAEARLRRGAVEPGHGAGSFAAIRAGAAGIPGGARREP